MWTSLRIFWVLFTVSVVSHFSHCQEFATVDHCANATDINWEFPIRWQMYCFNDSAALKQNATDNAYNDDVIPKGFNWDAFKGVNGIWAFFHQYSDPEPGLPLPAISYHENMRSFTSLHLTYFIYGNESSEIIITKNTVDDPLRILGTACNYTNCDLKFKTATVELDYCENEFSCGGIYGVTITLDTIPGTMVFIDKISLEVAPYPSRGPSIAPISTTTAKYDSTVRSTMDTTVATETTTESPNTSSEFTTKKTSTPFTTTNYETTGTTNSFETTTTMASTTNYETSGPTNMFETTTTASTNIFETTKTASTETTVPAQFSTSTFSNPLTTETTSHTSLPPGDNTTTTTTISTSTVNSSGSQFNQLTVVQISRILWASLVAFTFRQ